MQKVYGSLQPEMDVREKKHAALAREAAGEGFVLLENNGVLPLKDKKVALYGMGARKTVAGGTGSGEVQKRYTVSIEEGLENAGYLITTKQYLDDYDRTYEMSYQAWRDEVEESIAPLKHPIEALMKALSFSYRYPAGRLINQQDVEASQTDTAIYVIMRQAGEGNDRKWEEGDFLLTEEERANVAYLTKAYKDTIVVVNVGGMIDLSFMEELPGISALIYFVQGGMEGGNAFADVVSGKVNFSGKLTDSWPMAYKDIPAGESYSYLNGNLDNEDYTEGIYVGYRYYDSYGIKPRYAFGYGLSYTQFAMTTEKTWLEGTKVFAKVQVQNIGNVSGKEVVQAYVSCPVGKLHKEYQRLVAFAKTPVLAPDEVTTLTLSFDMTQAASFDERLSRWVLEAGDYVLRLGNASDCTQVATAIALEELVVTEVCQKLCAPVQQLTEIEIPASVDHEASETGVLYVEASAFNTLKHTYSEPIEVEDETTKEILDTLTIEEMAELVRGADLQTVVDGMHNITAAVGRTATTLQHKGLRNILFADGPAGVSVMEHVRIQEDGSEKAADIPSRYNWGPVADMMRMKNVAETGTDVYRYATAWPVEALLAQSWNLDLMQRIGQATGEEMELFGITLWLAPGMNIHRNPLCGRTFEYFSEDPYVSGKKIGRAHV